MVALLPARPANPITITPSRATLTLRALLVKLGAGPARHCGPAGRDVRAPHGAVGVAAGTSPPRSTNLPAAVGTPDPRRRETKSPRRRVGGSHDVLGPATQPDRADPHRPRAGSGRRARGLRR